MHKNLEKNKNTVSLKITTQDNHYFTGIYFEWYCKISARSNKSILIKSFYHKIYLHVKGILNQNKQI